MEFPDRAVRQEKNHGLEEAKLLLFADDIILDVENIKLRTNES
jgi:hypothetical protein